jgi:hypothetical protein
MVDEVKEPVKPKTASLAENAEKLNNNVSSFLVGVATLYPNLSQDGTLTTGHKFDETSKLFQDIQALRDKITPLTKDPRFGEQAKTVLAELMGAEDNNGNRTKHGVIHSANDQLTNLVSGKIDKDTGQIVGNEFKAAAWEKSFLNITDSIEIAKEQVAATPDAEDFAANDALKAAKDSFKASLDDIKKDLDNIKSNSLNTDMSRINESVQRQRSSQHSDMMCKQMYGNNWQKKQFLRIDNPKVSDEDKLKQAPGADFTMESQGKIGMGQDGFYRQENSDYIVQMREGVFTATYSPIQQDMGTKFDRVKERYKKWRSGEADDPFAKVGQPYSFAKQYGATVEALTQLANVNIIVFNYPNPQEFTKFHANNIEIAIADAKARLANSARDDSKKPLGFELGDGAMKGLMECREIGDAQRTRILQAVADIRHEYERQKTERVVKASEAEAPTADTSKIETPEVESPDKESVLSADGATPKIGEGVEGAVVEEEAAIGLEDVNVNASDELEAGLIAEDAAAINDEKKERVIVERVEDDEPRDLATLLAETEEVITQFAEMENSWEEEIPPGRDYAYIVPESNEGKEVTARYEGLTQKLDSLIAETQLYGTKNPAMAESKELEGLKVRQGKAQELRDDVKDSLEGSFKSDFHISYRPTLGN